MKKIISLLMSVALALSCVVSVIAAVPEDTSEVTQDSKEGNTDTEGDRSCKSVYSVRQICRIDYADEYK